MIAGDTDRTPGPSSDRAEPGDVPAAPGAPGRPRPGSIDVLIVRDPRESVRKCSLTPLRGMERIRFETYHPERRVAAHGRILLHPDGELLGPEDAGRDLLLIDCAWRRVGSVLDTVDGDPIRRRLPPLATAYPRTSKVFQDPGEGLASVEALYAALAILSEPRPELLAAYRWREAFLARNPGLAAGAPGSRR